MNCLNLPYNDYDMAALNSAVERLNNLQLFLNYDLSDRHKGFVNIMIRNPFAPLSSIVCIGISKIGKAGLILKSARWVVQSIMIPTVSVGEPGLRLEDFDVKDCYNLGCTVGKYQVGPLDGAIDSILTGKYNSASFENSVVHALLM